MELQESELRKEGKMRKGCCSSCCCCKRKESDSDGDEKAHSSQDGKKSLPKASGNQNLSRRARSRKNCGQCCKTFTAFLFSHIGLCSLVVAYSILGGFIFMKLEAPHEEKARNTVNSRRRHHIELLWNISLAHNIFRKENWSAEVNTQLLEFQREVYVAVKHDGWDGRDKDDTGVDGDNQWSFAGALLYAVTVITTIGYGHIAPKTVWGRLVTIAYAIIGIPLTLLCLANLGSFLGNCFRCIYKNTCRAMMWLCCPKQLRGKTIRKFRGQRATRSRERTEESDPLNKKISKEKNIDSEELTVIVDESVVDVQEKEEPVRVPIFVSLMILTMYIFAGALLFSQWEGWDYLIGSYFCFITLSTIGFGDFVPGYGGTDSLENQEKLIICAFYLIFGLSLIAMCFDLMQEEVRAKCRWVGRKLGIIKKSKK
ncbi:hypothetical protein ACJMK2_013028 [Sinanodonta woodiana]|uniref:Potassium channel domain-containing protein n=1 Tax=Sinanodonta woodiana TaxID=1069815 RepID=A0ABD3VA35_SINWO